MKNQEVVEILNNIAENLPKDIEDIYRKKGLDGITEISGIGLGIGKKIAEYLDTGKIKEFDELKKSVPESVVSKIEIAGSIRRKKDTVKDIDILVISKYPEKVMNYFAKLNNIKAVLAKGPTKSSVVLKEGINCDLRVVGEKSYGGALAYFTGSKEHNIRMRQIAIKKGMKLSEYGLFDRKDKYICGKNEEELYSKLGLPYVEPEMREDTGELELKKMPKLIGYNEIKGDLHMHTTWSDGFNSA